ncbi:MAG: DUF2087 domain-containing protein [Bacilli bacterium]|jgi:hypothetical protein
MFEYNEAEKEQALTTYFSSVSPLVLMLMPAKEKRKYLVLLWIAETFQKGYRYREAEINQRLEAIHSDYVTLRRLLVDFGMLGRAKDGSSYWRIESKAS